VLFLFDSTPRIPNMKALYKYPQAEFPYARLAEENRRRSKLEPIRTAGHPGSLTMIDISTSSRICQGGLRTTS